MAHHWEQVNAVHFCARLGKSPAETHDLLLQAYQQDALRRGSAKDYYTRFQKKGNLFPETYGRKSLGNVKNRSNRKEIFETVVSNSSDIKSDELGSEIKSDEHGSPKCLDINLHLQWGNDDSNDVDINPSNSLIKNFLNNIESSCNDHLKPNKLRISTNQDVQVGEVDDQTLLQKSVESEPVQEVNVDSTMEDIESSTLPIDETEEIPMIPSLPSPETEEIPLGPILRSHETAEIPMIPILLSHETEEVTSLSLPTHETEDIITSENLPSHEIEEITNSFTLPSYETEEITTISSDDETEEITTSSILPSHETEEVTESFSLLSHETDMISEETTLETTIVETPKTTKRKTPRKTRSKCRCLTCKLKS